MSDPAAKALTILVAEDSAADRMILEAMLDGLGHKVKLVEDGQAAVEAFAEIRPDLVFLDVLMPRLGGIEAARQIKSMAGDELVPVIFLTSLADPDSLSRCLDAGGDDFLSKPYNPTVLLSKIRAFARMRDMHTTLAANHRHLLQEQAVAKQVFDKIAHAGSLHLDNIRYYMSALAVFNGDVLLADVSPRGSLFVVLGDFTGHGLPAAIGSMPLASTFYGMVGKGFTMADILREINHKLHQTLPVGLFCCASFVDIDLARMRLRVWNGGLPDNVLHRVSGEIIAIKSRHLPLGILSSREFKVEPEVFELAEGDHLLLFSDGIAEARNRAGEMFGEDRLTEALHRAASPARIFDEVLGSVQAHTGGSEKDDDVSLVSIGVPAATARQAILSRQHSGQGFLQNWRMRFTLDASSLKTFNPLTLLVQILSEVPGLRQSSSVLFTLLSELYNNALEHGVLELDSSIKSSSAGFAEYYRMRTERLRALADAEISFDFEHALNSEGGVLTIAVTDSGQGFDLAKCQAEAGKSRATAYYGRGLALVDSIAEDLAVLPPGNRVRARYRWTFEEQ